MADTDALLHRAENGDLHARSELLVRHRQRLRRMVAVRLHRRLLPRVDASDVVQMTLVEAAQKLDGYLRDRPVPFYPWLRRLAWEQLMDLYDRHVKAQRRSVDREERSLTGLPDESAAELASCLVVAIDDPRHRKIEAETKSRVISSLSQLSEPDREILVLRYLEQLPGREIAAVLEISEAAARQRCLRALTRLTMMVRQDEGEE